MDIEYDIVQETRLMRARFRNYGSIVCLAVPIHWGRLVEVPMASFGFQVLRERRGNDFAMSWQSGEPQRVERDSGVHRLYISFILCIYIHIIYLCIYTYSATLWEVEAFPLWNVCSKQNLTEALLPTHWLSKRRVRMTVMSPAGRL